MNSWELVYNEWDPRQQPLREALCTLGNGYFATRGAFEWSRANPPHYPGTYLAGGYNRARSEVAGRVIENEDFVNWPNWLVLTFRPEGGDWFDLDSVQILEFRQALNLRVGTFEWRIRFRDASGRQTLLTSRRLVHMSQPHLAAIEWNLTPQNWSGVVEVRSAIDGDVSNALVARYRDLKCRHVDTLETGRVGDDGVYLIAETDQSHIRMAQAARTRAFVGNDPALLDRDSETKPSLAADVLTLRCERDEAMRVEKIVSLYSSRDSAINEPAVEARTAVVNAGTFEELLASHSVSWDHHWHRCHFEVFNTPTVELPARFNELVDVFEELRLPGPRTLMVVRLYIFHILQTLSINTIDLDVGVPARGLHGEAYRGHIFWDELFVFPFLNLRIPDLTRSLLMYRYRRLPQARLAAKEAGYRGAMFPWQSGSNGREECQVVHLNPESGRWIPDNTHTQRHVNAAIAYNVWTYFQSTNDTEFLSFYGTEMIVEIARFWASIAAYNPERNRYEIHGVVGPDEFHTCYPDSEEPGLNNNAYTNVMAAWVCRCALQALELISEDRRSKLKEDLALDDEEIELWDRISRNMFVPFHDGGIISQFEGYETLAEFDWEGYRKKYGDIQRLDRILEQEGDTPDRYKVGKQADVLMLFYLFSSDELKEILDRLGYDFDPESIRKNIDYYVARTSHGSTLSRVVHSWVLARSDRRHSWRFFHDALESDVEDIQGGTTQEGIHLGAMAGTIDLLQRCYTGVELRGDVLWLNPRFPEELARVRMRMRYRSHWVNLDMALGSVTVSFEKGWGPPVKIGVKGKVYTLREGQTRTFDLRVRKPAT